MTLIWSNKNHVFNYAITQRMRVLAAPENGSIAVEMALRAEIVGLQIS